MMKAVGIRSFGGREVLEVLDVPVPDPGPGEVLIRNKAASINPVDWKIRAGLLKDMLPYEFPIILGWDAAGIVVSRGRGAIKFREGDKVFAYCRKPLVKNGTYAEYVCINESALAFMPENMPFDEAACIPLAGLTAYQAIYDTARLKLGETILIHAAAGGVGGFAVQLARERGATVLATASKRNHEYLVDLGASEVIDYTRDDYREIVHHLYPNGIDVVFDCVGENAAEQSLEILKPHGRVVSITRPDAAAYFQGASVSFKYVFVEPDGNELTNLAEMVEDGALQVKVAARFALQDAAQAHAMIETGHTCGKIALLID